MLQISYMMETTCMSLQRNELIQKIHMGLVVRIQQPLPPILHKVFLYMKQWKREKNLSKLPLKNLFHLELVVGQQNIGQLDGDKYEHEGEHHEKGPSRPLFNEQGRKNLYR